MQEIKLQIVGWKKYQPQSDRSRHKFWFRVNMDCGTSHGLFGLSAEQRWFFVQLLCECCRKDSDSVSIKLSRFSKLCEIEEDSILSAIKLLEENGTVSILSVNCQSTVSPLSPHNKTEQDKTIQTKQNKTKTVCVEPKQVLVATPTVNKNDLTLFINQKLLELYPQEYLDREKVKMELWIANNQHKKPKSDRGMVRFVTSWLSRGWDQYRKGLQTNAPKKKTFEELLAEQEGRSGSYILQTTDRKT